MEVTQEKIEKVAQFANVSAAQAQQALEQCGGHQLEAAMETGFRDGMQTMRRALDVLIDKGAVSDEEAAAIES